MHSVNERFSAASSVSAFVPVLGILRDIRVGLRIRLDPTASPPSVHQP